MSQQGTAILVLVTLLTLSTAVLLFLSSQETMKLYQQDSVHAFGNYIFNFRQRLGRSGFVAWIRIEIGCGKMRCVCTESWITSWLCTTPVDQAVSLGSRPSSRNSLNLR